MYICENISDAHCNFGVNLWVDVIFLSQANNTRAVTMTVSLLAP